MLGESRPTEFHHITHHSRKRDNVHLIKNRTGHRVTAIMGAAVAVAAVLTGCSSNGNNVAAQDDTSSSTSKVTIRVVTALDNSFFFTPVQQAEFLKTFEGTNLDVQVVAGTTPTLGQILASGKADVALAGATTEAALRDQGIKQTIMASNYAPWDMQVVVNNTTDAKKIEDLKGANFGITGAGAPSDYSVFMIAKKLGWGTDYKTTTFGDVGSSVAAFRAGSINALAVTGDTANALQADGSGRIIGTAADYVGPTVLEAFSVMDSFAQKHPAAVKTFFEKYFDEVKKMQAKPSIYEDVLTQKGKFSPAVAEGLAKTELPQMSSDGRITDEQLKGLGLGAAFSKGDRSGKNPIDVDYSYWKTALK